LVLSQILNEKNGVVDLKGSGIYLLRNDESNLKLVVQ
jgi:hypothetical protein